MRVLCDGTRFEEREEGRVIDAQRCIAEGARLVVYALEHQPDGRRPRGSGSRAIYRLAPKPRLGLAQHGAQIPDVSDVLWAAVHPQEGGHCIRVALERRGPEQPCVLGLLERHDDGRAEDERRQGRIPDVV